MPISPRGASPRGASGASRRAKAGRVLLAVVLGAAFALVLPEGARRFALAGTPAAPFLSYRLALADPRLGIAHVRGEVVGAPDRYVTLRAFSGERAKRLDAIGFAAADPRGEPLPARAADGAWIVDCRGGDFTFDYDVSLVVEDRRQADVRDLMTILDGERCRFVGRDVFLVPELPLSDGVVVDISTPRGWRVAASCPSRGDRVLVPDLMELPFTMTVAGDYRRLERTIGGTGVALAISGAWSFRDEQLFDVIGSVVSKEISLFGPCPRDRYLFVCDGNPVMGASRFDYYGLHYGGSMMLLLDRRIDASELMDTPMAIIAHEFFHNWNGEASGPGAQTSLWFTEGVTNYVSYLVLREANVITRDQYANRRIAIFGRYRANPYAGRVSIGDAANRDMRDKNMVNLLYDGGFLAAEALDRRLRAETAGRVTLVDVLRRMYDGAGGSGAGDVASFLDSARALAGVDLASLVGELTSTGIPQPLEELASPLE